MPIQALSRIREGFFSFFCILSQTVPTHDIFESMDDLIKAAFARHAEAAEATLKGVLPEIVQAGEMIAAAAKSGRRLFACGNGGSAADAQHLTTEWVSRYKNDRDPLPAIALTVDTSALTAIGNDYGFEQLFARQVKALGAAGDVLVAITTSGQSKNVLLALEEARKKNMKTIALTGSRGTNLKTMADVTIVIPTDETARIQEMHELIYHAWCECVDASLS
jgi:D-sedoheptulose 7-phosphate isomerase